MEEREAVMLVEEEEREEMGLRIKEEEGCGVKEEEDQRRCRVEQKKVDGVLEKEKLEVRWKRRGWGRKGVYKMEEERVEKVMQMRRRFRG